MHSNNDHFARARIKAIIAVSELFTTSSRYGNFRYAPEQELKLVFRALDHR